MGESKTVIAFDTDIINTSLISWQKTYEILMKPIQKHEAAIGQIALQTITEPECPCNSGIVIFPPATVERKEQSIFKEIRKNHQKEELLEEAMNKWATLAIEGDIHKHSGKESQAYCNLDQMRREHDKNLWNNLPLAREEAESPGDLATRWIITATLFSSHCHPTGARTLREIIPNVPEEHFRDLSRNYGWAGTTSDQAAIQVMIAASNEKALHNSMPCSYLMMSAPSIFGKKELNQLDNTRPNIPITMPCATFHAYGKSPHTKNGLLSYPADFVLAGMAEIIGGSDTYPSAYQASYCSKDVPADRGIDYGWSLKDAADPEKDRISEILKCKCGCVNYDIATPTQNNLLCARCCTPINEILGNPEAMKIITSIEQSDRVIDILTRNNLLKSNEGMITTTRLPVAADYSFRITSYKEVQRMLDIMKKTAPDHYASLDPEYHQKAIKQKVGLVKARPAVQIPAPISKGQRVPWTFNKVKQHLKNLNEEDEIRKSYTISENDWLQVVSHDWADLGTSGNNTAPTEWSRFKHAILPHDQKGHEIKGPAATYIERGIATAEIHENLYDEEERIFTEERHKTEEKLHPTNAHLKVHSRKTTTLVVAGGLGNKSSSRTRYEGAPTELRIIEATCSSDYRERGTKCTRYGTTEFEPDPSHGYQTQVRQGQNHFCSAHAALFGQINFSKIETVQKLHQAMGGKKGQRLNFQAWDQYEEDRPRKPDETPLVPAWATRHATIPLITLSQLAGNAGKPGIDFHATSAGGHTVAAYAEICNKWLWRIKRCTTKQRLPPQIRNATTLGSTWTSEHLQEFYELPDDCKLLFISAHDDLLAQQAHVTEQLRKEIQRLEKGPRVTNLRIRGQVHITADILGKSRHNLHDLYRAITGNPWTLLPVVQPTLENDPTNEFPLKNTSPNGEVCLDELRTLVPITSLRHKHEILPWT